MSWEQKPSPDGTTEGQVTWYDYAGKPSGYPEKVAVGTGTKMPAVIAQVLPGGDTWYQYFEHNALGQQTLKVETYTKPDGSIGLRTNTFAYAANGIDMTLHIGPEGEQVSSNVFNAYHQVTTNYDALNQETRYTYDATTRLLTSVLSPGGLTTTNLYDGNQQLQKTIDLEIARTNSYTYVGDLVQSHTDERGLTVTNYWDDLRRLVGVKYPDGTTTSNVYTALDITATKDRLGHWSYAAYNGIRQKISETNANGVVTGYGLCDCGALLSVTNAWNTSAQMVTSFGYDFQGNRLYTYHPDATETNWFDALGRVIVTGDAWGYRWFYYNNQGLLTVVSNVYGAESVTVYDIDDHPLYVTDANGVTITNTYDALHRLSTRTYPDTGVERFGYSARGLVAYTNQLSQVTRYAYDAASRKTFETNANNQVIRYTNNAAGDLLSLTDGKNQTTKWKYDEYGRVTNKLDQAGTEILRYKYDPNSRLTNRWSAAMGDTKYKYDAVGSLTNIDYPSGTADVSFKYDALNRVTNMVDGVGTTKYAYAAGGQLWTEDGPWSNDTMTNTYSYRLRTDVSLQQPTGVWTNKFGYDAAKRLTSVVSPAGTFTYTLGATAPGSAQIKKLLLPNTSYITNTYDGNTRLLSTKLNNSSHTTLDAALYGYNAGNQRTAYTNAASTYARYSYDAIGQLKVVRTTNSSGVILSGETKGYAYDNAWNLSTRTNNSSGSTTTFELNNLNEMYYDSDSFSYYNYDANGNLTLYYNDWMSNSYDAENRLTSWEYDHTARKEFVYDGLGRLRAQKDYQWNWGYEWWEQQGETRYVYEGMRVIQERNWSGTPTVSYTRGSDLSGSLEGAGGIGGMLARSHGYSSGNWSTHNFYHADGNGNITYLVNSSQTVAASYRYDPYGNTISQSGSLADANVYRFSSKEWINNVGYYYGFRFYAPNLQRWLNRDPIGEKGGINLYGFVRNSPMHLIDPFGKSWVSSCASFLCSRAAAAGANNAINQSGINGNDDRGGGNAFRHCLAGCEVSKQCGEGGEKSWDGRENPGSGGGKQDLDNNKAGYDQAKKKGSCWDNCMAAWENGGLHCGQNPCPPPGKKYPEPEPGDPGPTY